MEILSVEAYTIWVTDTGLIVHNGRLAGARLKYRAPGIEIFVKGRVSIPMRDKVNYHAFSLARACHIPLIALVSEGWV